MSYEVSIDEIKEGTNIAFPIEGLIGLILSAILAVFDSDWRHVEHKFWHVGFVVERSTVILAIQKDPELAKHVNLTNNDRWWVCESLGSGVSLVPLSAHSELDKLRYFNIIKNQPTSDKVADYLTFYVGRPYDSLVYVWNIIAELLEKIHIHFGSWNNLSFMCWENLEAFMDFIDEGMVKDYDHVMCTDFAKAWGLV